MNSESLVAITTFDETASHTASSHARILVAISFPILRRSIAALLAEAGYWTTTAPAGTGLSDELTGGSIDVILVDDDGQYTILRQVRAATDRPIIAIVCPDARGGTVEAFDAGADDCIVWSDAPGSESGLLRELVRRIEARIRPAARQQTLDADVITGPAGLLMRPRAHEIAVSGIPVDLTPKEFAILRLLLERRGEVLTADEVSSTLWGHETFGSRNFVEAHVSRLRQKLRAAGASNVVTTVRGVGYKIR